MEEKEKLECLICILTHTEKTMIQCSCEERICRSCAKRYIMESLERPHCMFCSVSWSKEFLYKELGKKFVNGEYRTKRKEMLFHYEEALFPETMKYIEVENSKKEKKEVLSKYKDQMNELNKKKQQIETDRHKLLLSGVIDNYVEQEAQYKLEIKDITRFMGANNMLKKRKLA